MTDLGGFLKGQLANGSPWNCSTLAADWCVSLGHPDFAAAWRDVTDPDECVSMPINSGGLVVLWKEGIGAALPIVEDPLQPGDIAVVAAHGLEAGAIWTGERWAMKAARGLHFIAADAVEVLKAWRP